MPTPCQWPSTKSAANYFIVFVELRLVTSVLIWKLLRNSSFVVRWSGQLSQYADWLRNRSPYYWRRSTCVALRNHPLTQKRCGDSHPHRLPTFNPPSRWVPNAFFGINQFTPRGVTTQNTSFLVSAEHFSQVMSVSVRMSHGTLWHYAPPYCFVPFLFACIFVITTKI